MMLIVLAFGPTLFIFKDLVQSIGAYLQNLVAMSFNTTAYEVRTATPGGASGPPLGLVDLVGALRRRVHRADLARPHGASSSPVCCWSPRP